MQVNFDGVLIALVALAAIAFGHVFVRRGFRWFGKRFWPFSLVLGLALVAASLFTGNPVASGGLAVWGATFLWAVKEIFEQEERAGAGSG